jgi:hypothetical protein
MMATLVQELRNEEQFMADFVHGVVRGQASLDDFLSVVLLCKFGFLGLSLIRTRVLVAVLRGCRGLIVQTELLVARD